MFEKDENKFIGRVGLMEPVIISGKCYGVKIISALDVLNCRRMYKNTLKKLTEKGYCDEYDIDLCEQLCRQASIVSMTLYNNQNERVFADGISALIGFTCEEIYQAYEEYLKLGNKFTQLDKESRDKLENVKSRLLEIIRGPNQEKKGNDEHEYN